MNHGVMTQGFIMRNLIDEYKIIFREKRDKH